MESTVLIKAFGLLEVLAGHGDGQALNQLAQEGGLTKPTTHRILKTLTSLGYVEKIGDGLYRSTSRVKRLATGREDRRLLAVADPLLHELHQGTGETVNLAVLRQFHMAYLRVLESTHPLRHVASPDSSDPFHCTALGLAIAAHLPSARKESLLREAKLTKATPNSITDRNQLRRVFEQVHQDGYAIEVDQTALGVTCIGAPIFHGGDAIAAVSVSVPSARVNDAVRASLIAEVRETGARITAAVNQDS